MFAVICDQVGMSRNMMIKIPLFVFFLILPFISNPELYAESPNISYQDAQQLTESSHDVWLLSTITGSRTKAILKNLITQDVESYIENEGIDLITDDKVNLVKVYPCLVVIRTESGYEKITCEGSRLNSQHFRAEALWEYSVEDTENTFTSNKFDTTFDQDILNACSKHGVDPHLVKAIIKAESNFNPRAVSPKNARGLMQIIPATAKSYGVQNSFDPSSNINGGVKILKDLIDYFKDIKLAVAAYNAGKNAVIKYNNKIPPYPETRQYVKKVMDYYHDLKGTSVN